MKKRDFTLILPYYENPGMLVRQYRNLAALPRDVRKHLHLIVVDDGSPRHPAEQMTMGPNAVVTYFNGTLASFQLFRVRVDVRWNWIACRNIGAYHARTEWLLLTDIDHEVPEVTARRIIEGRLRQTNVYRFSRKDAPNLTDYKPHPNSWLMTQRMFADQVGGYDERFSGYYGTDSEFRDRIARHATQVVMLDEYLIRVPREVVPDASTTTYLRKQPEDREGVARVRAQIAREGGPPKWLSFPYHRVL